MLLGHLPKQSGLIDPSGRAPEGYEPLDDPFGDAPINPSLVGPWLQLQQGDGDPEADGDAQDADSTQPAEEPTDAQGDTPDDDTQPAAAVDDADAGETDQPSDEELAEAHQTLRAFALKKANSHHAGDGRFSFADGERHDFAQVQVRVVSINPPPDSDVPKSRAALQAAAVAKLKQWPKEGVLNDETGWRWVIGRDDWKKMAGWDKQTTAGLKAINGLEALVHAAVRAETHTDTKSNPNVVAVHRFYCPALIDDTLQRIKLTVKEYVFEDGQTRTNLHALEAVEIDNPGERLSQGPQGVRGENPPAQAPGSVFSMVALLAGVNRDSDGLPFGSSADGDTFAKAVPWVVEG